MSRHVRSNGQVLLQWESIESIIVHRARRIERDFLPSISSSPTKVSYALPSEEGSYTRHGYSLTTFKMLSLISII
jgi:hypothetical protein